MRTFSNDFRSSLNEIRQINGTVCYYSTDGYYILATENGDYLATENGDYLATEKGYITYDAEAINSIRPIFNVNLFKTICKAIEIEAIHKIDKGIPVCAKIGVLVNGTYEYMDYGNYKIIDKPIYQADTKSYLMVGYDKMIESMVKYDDNPLSITYPITHKNLVIAICNHFNWTYNLGNYTNYDKIIDTDLYLGQDMTYREILDDLCQATGTNFLFDLADVFTTKDITETNTSIDDNYIKDINVNFGEKYGKVNALTITSEGTTVIDNKEDSISIAENGKTEFNINNNKLLLYASELFIDDLFNKINGLEYYTYDIDTTGLLVYEPLDRFTINHNGVDYSCVMFNNDTQLTKGLKEIIYTDKPEETENEYISNAIDDKKINNAIVSINKAKGQVVLKANSDGKVVQATLNADADSGSEFTVKADNINLEGYTTINEGFSVDLSGNMTCNGAIANDISVIGGNIELQDTGDDSDPTIEIYDGIDVSQGTLQIGNKLDGKTLMFSFPNDGEQIDNLSFGGVWNNLIVTDNGNSIQNFHVSATGYEEVVKVVYNETETYLYLMFNHNVAINLTSYTLPSDFGKIISIDSPNGIYPYITTDNIRNKTTKFKSSGIRIYDENNGINTFYESNGLEINNNNGRTIVDSDLFEMDMNGHLIYFSTNPEFYTDSWMPIAQFDGKFEVLAGGTIQSAGGLFHVDGDGNLTCVSLTQTSKEDMKKNFEKLDNALDIIKNVDIYKYHMKEQDDKDKKHIGFVIGDKFNYSEEITSNNNDGVDLYSMISVCMKAIKEQQEQIEILKQEIKLLKESDK